jgi:hypothetical protein
MAVGDKVNALDFNGVRSLSVDILGTGSGSRGYGQSTSGNSAQAVGDIVVPGDYNSLRNNLFNSRAHQIGSAPAIAEIAEQFAKIVDTDFSTFASYANTCDANRLTAHPSRISSGVGGSRTRSTSWSSFVTVAVGVGFATADQARYFFNAGGNLRFTSSRSGGASSSQNTSWSNLLSAAGTQVYTASNFYSATSATTNLYTTTSSSPYASNRYTITNTCNVANNSSGGATILTFGFAWTDPYTDPSPGNPPAPEDIVDGDLSITVEYQFPVGGAALSGGGNWVGFNSGPTGGFYRLPLFSWSGPTIAGS